MKSKNSLVAGGFWLGGLLGASALHVSFPVNAQDPSRAVYRCPGPPIVYTDKISAQEARDRGCRTIEGAPVTIIQRPPHKVKPARPKVTSGSAFLVSTAGRLLTNLHVVSRCQTLNASQPGGVASRAEVIHRDELSDLALLKVPPAAMEAAVFRALPLRAGEQVIVLGFPYRGLLSSEVNVSTGTVSALAGLRNDQSKLQIQAPVQSGNSGGPLLDSHGFVAGIVVAKFNAIEVAKVTGDIPQNINFAVKGEVVQQFLRAAGVEPVVATSPNQRPDLADVVSRTKEWVYLLECRSN